VEALALGGRGLPPVERDELERAGLDRIFGIVATLSGDRLIFVGPTDDPGSFTLRAFDLVVSSPLRVDRPAATATIILCRAANPAWLSW